MVPHRPAFMLNMEIRGLHVVASRQEVVPKGLGYVVHFVVEGFKASEAGLRLLVSLVSADMLRGESD